MLNVNLSTRASEFAFARPTNEKLITSSLAALMRKARNLVAESWTRAPGCTLCANPFWVPAQKSIHAANDENHGRVKSTEKCGERVCVARKPSPPPNRLTATDGRKRAQWFLLVHRANLRRVVRLTEGLKRQVSYSCVAQPFERVHKSYTSIPPRAIYTAALASYLCDTA